MNNNSVKAMNAAVRYAGIENCEIFELSIENTSGLYELNFSTDLMEYCIFVDGNSLEVLGFDARPAELSLNETDREKCA